MGTGENTYDSQGLVPAAYSNTFFDCCMRACGYGRVSKIRSHVVIFHCGLVNQALKSARRVRHHEGSVKDPKKKKKKKTARTGKHKPGIRDLRHVRHQKKNLGTVGKGDTSCQNEVHFPVRAV